MPVEASRVEHSFVLWYGGDWGFHLINIYAMASAETEEVANRNVYAEFMRYTRILGNVPIFILGDFRPTTKGGSELEQMREKRGWRNIMEEWVLEGGNNTLYILLARHLRGYDGDGGHPARQGIHE